MRNPVHYRDPHTIGVPEEVFQIIPKEEIYQKTGIQLMRFNTLYQLYYLTQKEPELLAQTDCFAFDAGFDGLFPHWRKKMRGHQRFYHEPVQPHAKKLGFPALRGPGHSH